MRGTSTDTHLQIAVYNRISIHVPLAGNVVTPRPARCRGSRISIHVPLAGNVSHHTPLRLPLPNFYPRSPCGERHERVRGLRRLVCNFYPRSPCGERLNSMLRLNFVILFLSTFPLRGTSYTHLPSLIMYSFLSTFPLRGTSLLHVTNRPKCSYFYPRSPCGERRLSLFHAQ